MSKQTLRLESFKRDPDMLCDKTEYTAISHSSPERQTVVDWPVHVECSPLTKLYVAKINIKTDSFDSEAECLDQLGRWMIRLAEEIGFNEAIALTNKNIADTQTPATDAVIREIGAKAVDEFGIWLSRDKCGDRESQMELGEILDVLEEHAAKLRAGEKP